MAWMIAQCWYPIWLFLLHLGPPIVEEDENECKLHVEFEMLRWGGTTRAMR